MANNNSMWDESPSKKQRNIKGSMSFNMDGAPSKNQRNIDDDSSLRTLVSIDYVRVSNVILKIDGKEGKFIVQIDRTDEDISEGEEGKDIQQIGQTDEDRKIMDDESSDDEEKVLIIYGTMIVTDCWGDEIVFNEFPNLRCTYYLRLHPPLPLPLPLQISLSGPRRAISGEGKFVISVGFWGFWHSQGIVKEIAKGEIVWDPYKQDNKLSYNEPLQEHVSGKHGTVSVGYSVIQRALSATIDVVWMHNDENNFETEARMYGTIKAVGLLRGSPTERMLFDRPKDKGYWKSVYPGDSLFLSSLLGQEMYPQCECLDTFPFPVQIHSPLTIKVDLRDHLSPDGLSVQGEVQFTTGIGMQTGDIPGKYSHVKVYMTCK